MLSATSKIYLRGILIGLPHMLLAEAVLFANNVRDLKTDADAGIWNMAHGLGKKTQLRIYQVLIGGALFWTGLFFSPWVSGFTVSLCFWDANTCVAAFAKDAKEEFSKLPQKTALLVMKFGALLCTAILAEGEQSFFVQDSPL